MRTVRQPQAALQLAHHIAYTDLSRRPRERNSAAAAALRYRKAGLHQPLRHFGDVVIAQALLG
jgi:hypothetical protein